MAAICDFLAQVLKCLTNIIKRDEFVEFEFHILSVAMEGLYRHRFAFRESRLICFSFNESATCRYQSDCMQMIWSCYFLIRPGYPDGFLGTHARTEPRFIRAFVTTLGIQISSFGITQPQVIVVVGGRLWPWLIIFTSRTRAVQTELGPVV